MIVLTMYIVLQMANRVGQEGIEGFFVLLGILVQQQEMSLEVIGRQVDISTYIGWACGVMGYNVLQVVKVAMTNEAEGQLENRGWGP